LASASPTIDVVRHAAAVLDTAAVVAFVAIGRAVHTDGVTISGLASTAWPFASGLGAGWLALTARRLAGTSVRAGIVVLLSTVVIGMSLRVASGQGIAFAFVLVALGFLGAVMVGWRVGFALFRHFGAPSRQRA
jgi:hypothetical protein